MGNGNRDGHQEHDVAIDVEAYYRRYGAMVHRRCRFMLRDDEAALDAMQDVFVELLRRERDLVHSAPSSLLYTIATNVCLNRIRKNRRRPETRDDEILLSIAGDPGPEERTLTGHFLGRLFAREPESTRTIAVLHYVDGLTLEETAHQVGLSVSGVRKRLRQLRQRGLELKDL
jgi:RNA polymerase sigma-70 factor, ECF subfamily